MNDGLGGCQIAGCMFGVRDQPILVIERSHGAEGIIGGQGARGDLAAAIIRGVTGCVDVGRWDRRRTNTEEGRAGGIPRLRSAESRCHAPVLQSARPRESSVTAGMIAGKALTVRRIVTPLGYQWCPRHQCASAHRQSGRIPSSQGIIEKPKRAARHWSLAITSYFETDNRKYSLT